MHPLEAIGYGIVGAVVVIVVLFLLYKFITAEVR